MKFRFFVASSLLILLFLGCKRDDDSIVVMTLNLRLDTPRDSMNAWPNRSNQVFNFIKDEEPDIFGMQEVLWHQYTFLDSALTDYASTGSGRDDGSKGGELNPVFYRKDKFDLVRTITFWLSETPGFPGSRAWGSYYPRIVTWLELVQKETDKHFFFFNTHFAHDSDSARIMSSKLLKDSVSEISGEYPFIITGDLNMLPDSKGYSVLTGPEESLSILRDSYTISGTRPEGPGYTFNGFSDEPGRGRIDYIFVRNGMEVLEHKTVNHKEDDIFISDHWPVLARVLF